MLGEMSVASWSGSLLGWEAELWALTALLGSLFGRHELRESAAAYLDVVLSGVERKPGVAAGRAGRSVGRIACNRCSSGVNGLADELMHGVRSYVIKALGESGRRARGRRLSREADQGILEEGRTRRRGSAAIFRHGGGASRAHPCPWVASALRRRITAIAWHHRSLAILRRTLAA